MASLWPCQALDGKMISLVTLDGTPKKSKFLGSAKQVSKQRLIDSNMGQVDVSVQKHVFWVYKQKRNNMIKSTTAKKNQKKQGLKQKKCFAKRP